MPNFMRINGGVGIQFLGNEFVALGTEVAGFTIGAGGVNYTNEGANGATQIAPGTHRDAVAGWQ